MSNLLKMKWKEVSVQTKLARFTSGVVSFAQKAVVGNTKPVLEHGIGDYAEWVIVSIHGLKTYLNLPCRRLLGALPETTRISRILA